jgi:hypothetical protein
VQDVLKGVAGLTGLKGGVQSGAVSADSAEVQTLSRAIGELPRDRFPLMSIPNYAEIHVYEARLGVDGQMEWCEIVNLSFDRHYVGSNATAITRSAGGAAPTPTGGGTPPAPPPRPPKAEDPYLNLGSRTQSGLPGAAPALGMGEATMAKRAVANLLGIPADSPALLLAPPQRDAAAAPGHGLLHHKGRGMAVTRVVDGLDELANGDAAAIPAYRMTAPAVTSTLAPTAPVPLPTPAPAPSPGIPGPPDPGDPSLSLVAPLRAR